MNEVGAVLLVLALLAVMTAAFYGIGDWRHRRACEICRRSFR